MVDIVRNMIGFSILAVIIVILLALCPIVLIGIVGFIILAIIGHILLGFLALFGIHFKDDSGDIIKTWGDNKVLAGVIIMCIPAFLFLLFVIIWNILWVFEWFKWALCSGEPFLVFIALCLLVGAVLIIGGIIFGRKND